VNSVLPIIRLNNTDKHYFVFVAEFNICYVIQNNYNEIVNFAAVIDIHCRPS